MKEYELEEETMASVAEPPAEYDFRIRKMTREELEHDYITLEESDRRIFE